MRGRETNVTSVCVGGYGLRSRRLEVVGARKNGRLVRSLGRLMNGEFVPISVSTRFFPRRSRKWRVYKLEIIIIIIIIINVI